MKIVLVRFDEETMKLLRVSEVVRNGISKCCVDNVLYRFQLVYVIVEKDL